jgi:15-cis-phytoene synthase
MSSSVNSADLAACRALLRHGSKSFFAASLLLPRAVREPATALYAFCRVADDAIDTSDAPLAAVADLTRRLDGIYAGTPDDDACDRALAGVVRTFHIPRALLDALIDGFIWDASGRHYHTLEDVEAYAARVAGTVGVMMTLLMGTRAPWTLARAADLGVAMQLTNIARDVGDDARLGRIYLPEDWLRAEGVDPAAFLANPVFDARIARVVARLLDQAERLYTRAISGIGALPGDCRPAIHAARLIYADIARVVRRNGCDSVSTRAFIGTGRKLALLAEALAASTIPRAHTPAPALAATRYLIEAVEAEPLPAPVIHVAQPGGSRAGRVLDIFEAMERRERSGRTASMRVSRQG